MVGYVTDNFFYLVSQKHMTDSAYLTINLIIYISILFTTSKDELTMVLNKCINRFYESHKIRTLLSDRALSRVYEKMKSFLVILSLISKNPLMDIIMMFRNDTWTLPMYPYLTTGNTDILRFERAEENSGCLKVNKNTAPAKYTISENSDRLTMVIT